MNLARNLLLVLAGAVAALAVVLSCGNGNGAPDARASDASTVCDCPAPPQLIDERLRRIQATGTIATDATEKTVDVNCVGELGVGAVALWGGCRVSVGHDSGTLRLTESAGFNNGWFCEWKKEDGGVGNSYPLEAHVVCLVPEGTPPETDGGV